MAQAEPALVGGSFADEDAPAVVQSHVRAAHEQHLIGVQHRLDTVRPGLIPDHLELMLRYQLFFGEE